MEAVPLTHIPNPSTLQWGRQNKRKKSKNNTQDTVDPAQSEHSNATPYTGQPDGVGTHNNTFTWQREHCYPKQHLHTPSSGYWPAVGIAVGIASDKCSTALKTRVGKCWQQSTSSPQQKEDAPPTDIQGLAQESSHVNPLQPLQCVWQYLVHGLYSIWKRVNL